MDKEALPDMAWHNSKGIILGKNGKKLISFEPDRNGAVIYAWGAPGVGKTTCVIIPSARQWGLHKVWDKATKKYKLIQKGAVMVLDLKGDIYAANQNYRHIKRFSTIDVENSYHYDPLISARKMNEVELSEFLDNLAITLIPDENSADSHYFIECARGFFTAIFLYSLYEDVNKSFSDICLDITTHSYSEWGEKIEKSGYIPAIKYSNKYKDENPKNVGGGYSKLCNSLMIYTSGTLKKLLVNDDKCISPADLEKCIDVYIQIDPNTMDIYAPLVAMLFQVFMSAALHRKEGQNPPLAYIIDEFGQLPVMPVIQKSAMLMRAYNATILISTQSLASIDQHYGENGRKLLMDCAKAHCFLSINDPDTRSWASKLIGTRKVLKVSNSLNHSNSPTNGESVTEARENVFEPEAFSLLPDDHSVIIWKSGHYIKGKTCYYKDKQ
jgi:type IV secretory pathway TraG/TraD family ATPase VirD4